MESVKWKPYFYEFPPNFKFNKEDLLYYTLVYDINNQKEIIGVVVSVEERGMLVLIDEKFKDFNFFPKLNEAIINDIDFCDWSYRDEK